MIMKSVFIVLLAMSSIAIYTVTAYSSLWWMFIVSAVTFMYCVRKSLLSARKRWLIALIKQMSFVEFAKLYSPKMMLVPHRIYDHAQVLISLAKWADIKTGNQTKFYDRMLTHLKQPNGNSAMMDIVLTITYLLANKKETTLNEIQSLIGESEFTRNHSSAYSLYIDIINKCSKLTTVITVNDTGKDWHIDDAVALFVLFNVLMLAKPPDMRLYIIGAGRDPETATHNHKVLATGILGDEIEKVYFLNSPGAANEDVTGVQHVVLFLNSSKVPSTCSSEVLLSVQHADIVAFCAETSSINSIIHINALIGGIQGGFEQLSSGAYKGFNALQSHEATKVLEEWTETKVDCVICATKAYAENLSQHGTDLFNKLLWTADVHSIHMQLSSLLTVDPIRYAGVRRVIPDLLISDRLYDALTPILVQLGILHNPSVWVLSMPGMRDQLTNATMINLSAALYGRTITRKLQLFLQIAAVKIALYVFN